MNHVVGPASGSQCELPGLSRRPIRRVSCGPPPPSPHSTRRAFINVIRVNWQNYVFISGRRTRFGVRPGQERELLNGRAFSLEREISASERRAKDPTPNTSRPHDSGTGTTSCSARFARSTTGRKRKLAQAALIECRCTPLQEWRIGSHWLALAVAITGALGAPVAQSDDLQQIHGAGPAAGALRSEESRQANSRPGRRRRFPISEHNQLFCRAPLFMATI